MTGNKYEIHFQSQNSQNFHSSQRQQKLKKQDKTETNPKEEQLYLWASYNRNKGPSSSVKIFEYEFLPLETNEGFVVPHSSSIASNSGGYLPRSAPLAEGKASREGREVGIRAGHLGGHTLPLQPPWLAAGSLGAADTLRARARPRCLNSKSW